ncbi:MAG: phospholipase [Rickettsiales bacterium]|nr:phospholipase [Rickettsiales bacterium]|tara:strand:- start:787 stop:1461 length:675 start_codon:yes stop_codon:yes gene_type:complete
MQFCLSGHAVSPNTENTIENIVLFLHGLGSNGEDLIQLAPYFASKIESTVFISPNAPEACDIAPPEAQDSFQWFSLQNRDPQAIEGGVAGVTPRLHTFMDEILAHYKVSAKNLYIVGFSQGTMMSLFAAPRYKEQIGGIVGFSGALPGGMELAQNPEEFKKMPILLIHGEEDDVVPHTSLGLADIALRQTGFDVKTVSRPGLGHSIDEEGLVAAIEFVEGLVKK